MDMQYETSKSNALHFDISGKPQCLDIGLLKKCIEDRKHVHSLDIQRSVALQVKKSFLNIFLKHSTFFHFTNNSVAESAVVQNVPFLIFFIV